jgi:hypothetical protein
MNLRAAAVSSKRTTPMLRALYADARRPGEGINEPPWCRDAPRPRTGDAVSHHLAPRAGTCADSVSVRLQVRLVAHRYLLVPLGQLGRHDRLRLPAPEAGAMPRPHGLRRHRHEPRAAGPGSSPGALAARRRAGGRRSAMGVHRDGLLGAGQLRRSVFVPDPEHAVARVRHEDRRPGIRREPLAVASGRHARRRRAGPRFVVGDPERRDASRQPRAFGTRLALGLHRLRHGHQPGDGSRPHHARGSLPDRTPPRLNRNSEPEDARHPTSAAHQTASGEIR